MCIPTFVDFFLFHLFFFFFFFLCFLRFLFPSFPFSLLAGTLWHFFLLFAFVCQLDSLVRSFPIFFFIRFLSSWSRRHCNATPHAPTHVTSSLLTIHFSAGDQLVVPRWGNAHFLPLQEYDRGSGRKREGQMNKHEQCLGLTQSRRRVCNTTFSIAYMD